MARYHRTVPRRKSGPLQVPAGSGPCGLFVAHPGHEILVYGWLRKERPEVFVLTDGSGYAGSPRLASTRRLLRSARVPGGTIFGRMSDREAYEAMLAVDAGRLAGIAEELASAMIARRMRLVVADATEGYNPVHDLCRPIVGLACTLAAREGVTVRHYEFSVVDSLELPTPPGSRAMTLELDDETFATKLSIARSFAPLRQDVAGMLERFGENAFRRETFRSVEDWSGPIDWPEGRPQYETIGEERVARGRYDRVLRYGEHVRPLQIRLKARLEDARCAS
jgi:hypothetical protein